MRLTEFIAVVNEEVEPNDPRITHLERLPRQKWNKKYRTSPKSGHSGQINTVAGYDEEP